MAKNLLQLAHMAAHFEESAGKMVAQGMRSHGGDAGLLAVSLDPALHFAHRQPIMATADQQWSFDRQ